MAWFDGGSNEFSFNGKKARTVTAKQGDTKYNAIWKDGAGVTEGTHYWELKVLEGRGAWFGVTNMASLGEGYKCKGMTYGGPGNVSNVGALLIGQYGPEIATGDKIGCLVQFEGKRLVVIFYHNGRCLGPAFDLQSDSWAPLFPLVSLGGKDQEVEIDDTVATPTVNLSEPQGNVGPIGNWRAEEYECTMKTSGDTSKIDVNAKVVNTISGSMAQEADGKWKTTGPCRSTRMMGPPDMMEKEQKVEKVFENGELKLDGENLVLTGNGESIKFSPFVEETKPITDLSRLRLVGA